MGNFERLSVLVIVVIIVLIVVIALVQLTSDETEPGTEGTSMLLVQQPEQGPRKVDIPVDPPGPKPFDQHVKDKLGVNPPPPPPPPVDPEPRPAPEAPAAAEPKIHVVRPGQTIARIARDYFPTSVTKGTDAILKANPQVDPARMAVGSKLVIPPLDAKAPAEVVSVAAERPAAPAPTDLKPGSTYVTKRGDTLAAISKRAYGRTDRWQDIWLANYEALGDNVDRPTAGTRLRIP